ncbi:MAG: hypothetical protein OEV06_12915, partial [Anaerolineae bacterium]|nr:hypothetical protein [Anaerolineae bacterium]
MPPDNTDHLDLDPDRQQQARRYAAIRRRLMLVSLVFNAAYVLAWLLAGWSLDLRRLLETYTQNEWLLVPAFTLAFSAAASLYEAPMSYYSGFVLPHRFGLSNQSLKEWLWDNLKGLLVAGPIGLVLLE